MDPPSKPGAARKLDHDVTCLFACAGWAVMVACQVLLKIAYLLMRLVFQPG